MILSAIVKALLLILFVMQVSQAALQPVYLGLADAIKSRQVKFYSNLTDLTSKTNGFTALTTNQPIVINGNFYFRPSIQNSNPQASKVQGLVVGFVNATGVQNLDGAYNITWKCFGYKPNLTNLANTLSARAVSGNMQMNAPTTPGNYYMFVTNASYVKTGALSDIATLCQNQLNNAASDERLMDLQSYSTSDAFNFTTYAPAPAIKRLFNESGNLVTVNAPSCPVNTNTSVIWPASQSLKGIGQIINATNAMCVNGIVRSATTRTCIDNLDGSASWSAVSGPGCQATCTGPINNLNIGTIWSGDPSLSYNAGAYGICQTDVPRNLTKSVIVGCMNTAAPGQSAGSFTFNSGATCAPRLTSYPSYNNLVSNNTVYVNPYNPLGNNGTINPPSPSNEYWSMGTFAYYRNLYLGADPTGTGIKPDNGNVLESWADISGNMRDIDLRGGINPIVWLSQSGGTLRFNNTIIFSNRIDMDGRFANKLRFQFYVNYQVLSDPTVYKPRYNVATLNSPYLFIKVAHNKYSIGNYHTVFGYWGPATWNTYPTVNCGIIYDYPSNIALNTPTTAVIKDNGIAQIVYYGTNPAGGCGGCKYCCWWAPSNGPAQYQSSALYNNSFSAAFYGGTSCQSNTIPYNNLDVGYGGLNGIYLGDYGGTSTGINAVVVVQPANHVNWWSFTTIRNCSACGWYNTAMPNWGWDGCCIPGARVQNWNGNNFFYDMQMANEQRLTFNIRKYILKNNIGHYDSCPWTNNIMGQSGDLCW